MTRQRPTRFVNSTGRIVTLLLGACIPFVLAAIAHAQETLFFSRDFPGSIPPYFEVELTSDGNATYRDGPDEEEPWTFTLRPHEAKVIFQLVRELDGLKRPIKNDRKVAFTGDKVFRYDGGNGQRAEAAYVYTEEPSAKALESWFLRMAESANHLFELERVVRFDRLGVNKALLYFQTSFDKNRIVASHHFLPVLRKVAGDQRFVHIARARAAALIERIEAE